MAANAVTGFETFAQRKRSVLFARRLRALAIVVVLGSIVVVAGHLPAAYEVASHAEAVGTAPAAVSTDADYFPSHFAPPKGEPTEPVASF